MWAEIIFKRVKVDHIIPHLLRAIQEGYHIVDYIDIYKGRGRLKRVLLTTAILMKTSWDSSIAKAGGLIIFNNQTEYNKL